MISSASKYLNAYAMKCIPPDSKNHPNYHITLDIFLRSFRSSNGS